MASAPEAPIACTLDSGDLPARLAWIRRVTDDALVAHRRDGATLHLVYDRRARDDLERIVAAERACCAFLDFDLADTGGQVELRIRAPAGLATDAHWLFEQFLPRQPRAACSCGPSACG
ncbi:MAG TPA: hypothetical protein VIN75_22390 [Burkholderiaceae bacterium]